uniref:Uncharacterized protein n=1 Tax=Candidatus Kentrum sp. UNK TaxID=2126344 RepID=A0A450ZWN7_9GAMM|nr:MAG: hypothetical protein BECKUNK1418G_GA0071005_100239 [Candidatus Kentron sp. UNK]VFK68305.1 MAG: hypothetical protein BECKUNK1418H_GA0071006_100139 [Candidatus Kentron sp. UNK]
MNTRQEIQARIKEQCLDFKEVAGAADYQALLSGRINAPGAYVFPDSQKAGENTLVNGISQRVNRLFGITIAVRNVSGARNVDSSDENTDLCNKVCAALLGWSPTDCEPIEYVDGQLMAIHNGFHLWMERYRTATQIRKV